MSSRRKKVSALKVEPGHLGALIDRARMHLEGLDYVAALALTARAFRLAPKDPQVALTHALAMRANGNCDGAEQLLLAWQDRQPIAIYNLGVLKLRCRDDAAGAMAVFKLGAEGVRLTTADHRRHRCGRLAS